MNAEDQKLARAVVRRLCSETASWTDARLDADPITQWVECLFRKVRDEAKAGPWVLRNTHGCYVTSISDATHLYDADTAASALKFTSREEADAEAAKFGDVVEEATPAPSADRGSK
jgi:hypothetical protein